ncbi:hypothetical protein VB773_02405 [Haloarculaceae archaeon H-GB2-1]|nr:hypothetical protein [Haloarculaceae archaeon H-GB1-1]MEA5406544.1 hypothetical protein [Haloarculaceae archaeon H-GB2-1]
MKSVLNSRRSQKLLLIIALSGIAALYLTIHVTGSFHPWYQLIGYATVASILAVFWLSGRKTPRTLLATGSLFALIYKTTPYVFLYTETGSDTGNFLESVHAVIAAGSTEPIISPFYRRVPLFHIQTAVFKMISSSNLPDAFAVHSISSVVLMLSCYVFIHRVTTSEEYAAIGAIVTGLMTMSLHFSVGPNPNFYATFLVATSLVCLLLYASERDKRYGVLFGIVGFATVFSHKIPVFVLFSTVIGYAVIAVVSRWRRSSTNPFLDLPRVFRYVAIVGGLLALQWVFVGGFLKAFTLLLAGFFGDMGSFFAGLFGGGTPAQSGGNPVLYASSAGPENVLVFLRRYGYIPSTLAIGGVGWILASYFGRDHDGVYLILSVTGVLGLLSIIAYFTSSLSQERTVLLGEFAFVAVFFIGYRFAQTSLSEWFSIGRIANAAIVPVVLLFLLTQLFVPTAVVDHPEEQRRYFTQGEAAGVAFSDTYVSRPIYSDWLLCCRFDYAHDTVYKQDSRALFNRSLSPIEHPRFYHRDPVVIYEDGGSVNGSHLWYLEYNLEMYLDRRYNKVYTSGDGRLYASGVVLENKTVRSPTASG